jgi:FKBP-type peptidyl-prolyl cis-trans isomerase FkpA
MQAKLPLIAAFSALLALSACGGGGGSDAPTPAAQVYNAPALVKTDTVVGTGAEAAVGKTITVNYTLWLYDSTKTDFKGTKLEANDNIAFPLSSGGLIEGWVQGIPGMKVGGKRTLIVPASMGYGAAGRGGVPGNSGLVFDVELTAVK